MGIFDAIKRIRLFGGDKTAVSEIGLSNKEVGPLSEYAYTLAFNNSFDALLKQDAFIARSDYKHLISQYEGLSQFYMALLKSNMLGDYIFKHHLDQLQIDKFLTSYEDIRDLQNGSSIIKKHNSQFVAAHLKSEKPYLDNILKACDPAISLDDEQREVVLSNEDHTLVIAGAGAGKTTTVAAKVRYLVEKQGIDPSRILVISFTNKAVEELRDRINHRLHIDCPITTFHSIGYTILRQGNSERKRVVDGGFMYHTINEYLKSTVLRNQEMVDKLILFFGSYFSAPYEGQNLNDYFRFVANTNFSTIKSDLREYAKQIIDRKTHKAQTLNNEVLRSMEEVRIANFLYLNQIEYEYEPIYQYRILDSNKPYTPDFRITQGDKTTYIEHFGITEDGRSSRYTEQELSRYKSRINDKIRLHRHHHTDLIYTFSIYNDGRDYLEHLRESLEQRGYQLNKRPAEDVYKKIVDKEESKYITRLVSLICCFIGNFKTQGYKSEQFDEFRHRTKNVRTKLFLDICRICYYEYQQALDEQHYIDFEDMINESAKLIRKKQIYQEHLDYKYIIVDEYQDISRQRYNLIREISKLCDAKIVAVGDDWQSIYAFSGSVLPLFTKFCKEVGYGQELKITRTYRNAQEIIDIAGTFVQRNNAQIRKELISSKRIDNPIIIYPYSEELGKGKEYEKGGRYHFLGQKVNMAIEHILQNGPMKDKSKVASILLIGRYGFDARNLCFSGEFNYDERTGKVYSTKFGSNVKLQFLTAHSSKGLSAENVIIINAKDELYGFPSKIEDDPVLNLVVSNDNSYDYAEERRLFYVALTRTKNRVYIVTPEKRPSEFIKELLREKKLYPKVTLAGELKSDLTAINNVRNRCPICGYPMQFRWNKSYGLKLWICTNDQEVCGFMTNDQRGGNLSIHKCDWCQDGYLVVKSGSRSYFLGCTNYKADKSGCSRMLDAKQYSVWLNHNFGMEDISATKPTFFVRKVRDVATPPKMIPTKETASIQPRRTASVNTIQYAERVIEKDKFNIVVDANGNILTDMELLQKLIALRKLTTKVHGVSIPNQVLVSLATDKPTTREEFMAIRGIGTHINEKCGDAFIIAIQHYICK